MKAKLEIALQRLELGLQEGLLQTCRRYRSWVNALLLAALICMGLLVNRALQQPFAWQPIQEALVLLRGLLVVLLVERGVSQLLQAVQVRMERQARARARDLAELLPLLSQAPP